MAVEQIVKERELIDNKWVVSERKLNEESDAPLVFKTIVLESGGGELQAVLKLDDDGVLKLEQGANTYRILVTGINSQSGEVVFDNSRSVRVDFPRRFKHWPAITLTLADVNNAPPYRLWPGKTGFTVRFKQRFTGVVCWVATEA